MNDAGRIGFVIKGEYNNTETYDFLDVVYYGNSSYVAKKLTVGNTPADNNEYWQALAKVPVSAVLGVKGNAENVYRTGNVNLTPENIGALSNTKEGRFFQKLNLDVEGYSYPSNCIYKQELDLNEVNESGLYFCSNPIHAPNSNGNGFMIAITYAGKIRGMQIYMPVGENKIYKRQNTNNAWGTWMEIMTDTYAKKSIYDDNKICLGSISAGVVSSNSIAAGYQVEASGPFSIAVGDAAKATGTGSMAAGGFLNVDGKYSQSFGYSTNASNFASHVLGKYNKSMMTGGVSSTQTGDVFVIGNGFNGITSSSGKMLSNALRVTYAGDIYGTKAFQSSGADYAEFIKPWADGNPDQEDRVGYFVTVKDGLLEKANEGDYIVGITSGNPSIVGNADEDYYWRYERDEFNRIVLEDVPETVQKTDKEGKLVFDEETHQPVMIETGKIIPKARMKLSKDYDPALQQNYIERKDRKEWDYVGMLGVLPVRDDGSCQPGQFCKCAKDGIATLTKVRGFDTYMVLERISENIVSVILK